MVDDVKIFLSSSLTSLGAEFGCCFSYHVCVCVCVCVGSPKKVLGTHWPHPFVPGCG